MTRKPNSQQELLDSLFGLVPGDRTRLRRGLVPRQRYGTSPAAAFVTLTFAGAAFVSLQRWSLLWTFVGIAIVALLALIVARPLVSMLASYSQPADRALVSLVEAHVHIEILDDDGTPTPWLRTSDQQSYRLPNGFVDVRLEGKFRLFLACGSGVVPGMQYHNCNESLEGMEPLAGAQVSRGSESRGSIS